jgi:hypothetical protein
MKNHFIISYPGNKREEVARIYAGLDLRIGSDEPVEVIAEPFAGTSALSFYISTRHPGMFKYRINDVCSELCDLYRLMKDPEGLEEFQNNVNRALSFLGHLTATDNELAKATYKTIISGGADLTPLESWYIAHKVYNIHHGLFPPKYKYKAINICGAPIVAFMRKESVEVSCGDGVAFIKECAKLGKKGLIFADPPYISQCNAFYDDRMNLNFYEWIYNAKSIESPLYMVLECHWILDIILGMRHGDESARFEKVAEWDKVYQMKKHTLTHVMWRNSPV